MVTVALRNGWLEVPYSGPENAVVEVCFGTGDEERAIPAYLDWNEAGERVAKIRPVDGLGVGAYVTVRASGNVVLSARIG